MPLCQIVFVLHYLILLILEIFTGFCRQCRGDLSVHLTEKVQPDTMETSPSIGVC